MKNKRRTNLQSWLFILNGIVAIVSALAISVSILYLLQMQQETQNMFLQIEKLEAAYQAETYLQKMDLSQRALLDRFDENGQSTFEEYNALLDSFLAREYIASTLPQEQQILESLLLEKENYDQLYAKTLSENEKGRENINYPVYAGLRGSMQQSTETLYAQTSQLLDLNNELTLAANAEAVRYAQVLMQIGLGAFVLFIVISLVVVVLVSSRVYQPIFHISAAISALREERFDPEILNRIAQRTDEMGKLAEVFLNMAAEIAVRQADLISQAEVFTMREEQQNLEN
ncbi:MAG: hypothetical protein HN413_12155 [Chloroflexi bacterium]|jgi:nitrate/nitrite-specific signal transduction histidine kinase|nr:hypothetical protein [Chloroflexota bacterium]